MNQYKQISFLKLTIRFVIVFFILVTFIRLFMGFFKFDGITGLKNEYYIDGKWQVFLKVQVMMSLMYGLLMAGYYKFIKK